MGRLSASQRAARSRALNSPSAQRRRAVLDGLDGRGAASDVSPTVGSAVNRRAVLAGAPARLPAAKSLPRGQGRAKTAKLIREQGFIGAQMARAVGGRGIVHFEHPGASGHERCREICVSYA